MPLVQPPLTLHDSIVGLREPHLEEKRGEKRTYVPFHHKPKWWHRQCGNVDDTYAASIYWAHTEKCRCNAYNITNQAKTMTEIAHKSFWSPHACACGVGVCGALAFAYPHIPVWRAAGWPKKRKRGSRDVATANDQPSLLACCMFPGRRVNVGVCFGSIIYEHVALAMLGRKSNHSTSSFLILFRHRRACGKFASQQRHSTP